MCCYEESPSELEVAYKEKFLDFQNYIRCNFVTKTFINSKVAKEIIDNIINKKITISLISAAYDEYYYIALREGDIIMNLYKKGKGNMIFNGKYTIDLNFEEVNKIMDFIYNNFYKKQEKENNCNDKIKIL